MSAIPSHDGASPHDGPGTLGGLLYADKTRARVPESEWVALVRGIAAADAQALHELYARSHRLVFTLALRITGSPENAEEVTVDTFHEVWRRAGRYDPAGGTVLGWIMNQARSRAIDRVRFDQRKKRVDPGLGEPASGPAEQPAAAELDQLAALLRQALVTLNDGEREAIEQAYFGELSHAEIAIKLQQPLGTVKTRIRSGLAKLRQALGGRP